MGKVEKFKNWIEILEVNLYNSPVDQLSKNLSYWRLTGSNYAKY